jgi:hypothetical protein
MKRILVLAAAAVVLASNAWILVSTAHNRSESTGGTVELTERELGLPPMWGDSTAIFLDLKWNVRSGDPELSRSPDWLTLAKLGELGFDCRMPVTDPEARDRYAAVPPSPVYLVLEYEGEAWKTDPRGPEQRTRLYAVDAGLDAPRLRKMYPDPARHIVVRAVVGLRLVDRSFRDGAPFSEPRLRGSIQKLLPGHVFVPPPYSLVLQELRRRGEESEEKTGREPRFAVKISWGRDHEPWLEGVRLLTSKGLPQGGG